MYQILNNFCKIYSVQYVECTCVSLERDKSLNEEWIVFNIPFTMTGHIEPCHWGRIISESYFAIVISVWKDDRPACIFGSQLHLLLVWTCMYVFLHMTQALGLCSVNQVWQHIRDYIPTKNDNCRSSNCNSHGGLQTSWYVLLALRSILMIFTICFP